MTLAVVGTLDAPRRLVRLMCDLFGLSVAGANRYVADDSIH